MIPSLFHIRIHIFEEYFHLITLIQLFNIKLEVVKKTITLTLKISILKTVFLN